MSYGLPPLFKQGPSARARLIFFAVLSLVLMLADTRLQALNTVRESVTTALYPLQRLMLLPGAGVAAVQGYFSTVSEAQLESERLRRERIETAQLTSQAEQLLRENQQLRELLALKQRQVTDAVVTEVLFEQRDGFRHHLVIDRGRAHGLEAGMPVIDDGGVVGQVVRVGMLNAEVRLITDRDMTLSVQSARSGLTAIAFGGEAPGRLGLRFLAPDVDLQPGDVLVTSGLDGVYPPGLPVATIATVDRQASGGFARIVAEPNAALGTNRHYLVLRTEVPDLPDSLPMPRAGGRG